MFALFTGLYVAVNRGYRKPMFNCLLNEYLHTRAVMEQNLDGLEEANMAIR